MSVILGNGKRVIEAGDFAVSIGGQQPNFSGSADVKTTNVVEGKFEIKGNLLTLSEN